MFGVLEFIICQDLLRWLFLLDHICKGRGEQLQQGLATTQKVQQVTHCQNSDDEGHSPRHHKILRYVVSKGFDAPPLVRRDRTFRLLIRAARLEMSSFPEPGVILETLNSTTLKLQEFITIASNPSLTFC
jgi:hypothetical protein